MYDRHGSPLVDATYIPVPQPAALCLIVSVNHPRGVLPVSNPEGL